MKTEYARSRIIAAIENMNDCRKGVTAALAVMPEFNDTATKRSCYDNAEAYCDTYQRNLRKVLAACGLGVEEWE